MDTLQQAPALWYWSEPGQLLPDNTFYFKRFNRNFSRMLGKQQYFPEDANFIDMWGDPYLVSSLRNNLILLLVIPITLILAAVLATIMNKAIYGKAGARALYFLPYVTNMVAIATVWPVSYTHLDVYKRQQDQPFTGK